MIGKAIAQLRRDFPAEAEKYEKVYSVEEDTALAERIYLINPLLFIASGEESRQAQYYRILVGASDADTI